MMIEGSGDSGEATSRSKEEAGEEMSIWVRHI